MTIAASTARQGPDPTLVGRALDVLCAPDMAPIVEMVLHSPYPDIFEARAVDGFVRFRRLDEDGTWQYQVVATEGRDPLAIQDPARFSPLADERDNARPARHANSYPLAFERAAQIFDHPCAPDLCVLHTAAHRPGSHRGEHGSLSVVQSRGPFVAAGPGIRPSGMVHGHCAAVDLAPTLLALLGADASTGVGPTGQVRDGLYLARQDGRVLTEILDPAAQPAHVVVVLLDGANANVLYAAAAEGRAPHLARLIDTGVAFAHGTLASLPTVTLANHTTLLTGAHPGHHGVLHNAWYDRSLGQQVVTESPATWQEAMRWLFPGVETVHQALHRRDPAACSVSINEPADRGADYSTFDLFREGRSAELLALAPDPLPHASAPFVGSSKPYGWGSLADTIAVGQLQAIWGGRHLGVSYPAPPRFTWISLTLTDAAFHDGGPYAPIAEAAVADTDARLGQILSAIQDRGVAGETAVVVVADHGMEENDPECTGSWGPALRAAGVAHRDEAGGFLYLGETDGEGPGALG